MTQVKRHLRMTENDRRRKVARQFARRLAADSTTRGNIAFKLGTAEYWRLYDEYLKLQDGKCAICGTDQPGGRGRFHLDHCHDTLEFRGLLCSNCNLKLGFVTKHLTAVLRYLGYEVIAS